MVPEKNEPDPNEMNEQPGTFKAPEPAAKSLAMSTVCKMIILLLAGIISFTLGAKLASAPRFQNTIVSQLEDSRNKVFGLSSASAGVSTAITLLPSDVGTPIADKLADLSGYFILILGALYLEKYLFLIMGTVACKILIPLACLMGIVYLLIGRTALKKAAVKLLIISLAFYFAVPVSVGLSSLVDSSVMKDSDKVVETAQESSKEITDAVSKASDGESGALEQAFSTISGDLTKVVHKFENILSNFIDAIGVMIITSCVIPVLVLVFLIWIIKSLTGVVMEAPKWKNPGHGLLQLIRNAKTSSHNH